MILFFSHWILASGNYNPIPRIPEKRVLKEGKSRSLKASDFLCKEGESLQKCHERFKQALKRVPAGEEYNEEN
jgi:hypothetical protein